MATPPIFTFFKKVDKAGFPDATSPSFQAANKEVSSVMASNSGGKSASGGKGRKRKYGAYSPETRAKIARYAIENGNTAAAKHYVLKADISESTVRGMKASYEKLKKMQGKVEVISCLPKSPRGRPLLLGKEYDGQVCEYLRGLRAAGGVVNSRIVIAAAKGIILANDRTALTEFGGHISLFKTWAHSILNRLNMVKRKGTKGVKHLPENFDKIQTDFVNRVKDTMFKYNIPDSLVINWDQTGSNFVPVGEWTMEVEGSKQVPIAHMDDKRQMTVLLACTKSASILPPQLVYQGKTDYSHPNYNFPQGWDITHTESHWSNGESMLRFVEKVIVPYVDRTIDENDLPLRQRIVCI